MAIIKEKKETILKSKTTHKLDNLKRKLVDLIQSYKRTATLPRN